MFRYLILADGFAANNSTTMTQLARDKVGGWKVSDAISVQLQVDATGKITELPAGQTGILACKIVLQ
jgi:bisphosphoglycerate-independent phosphoglycerate mutase (AlkP superfamily)